MHPRQHVASGLLRRGDLVRIRDERWTIAGLVSHGDTTVITAHGCDRSNRGARATYLLPCEPLERLAPSRATRVVSRRRFGHLAREVLASALPSNDALQAAATADITILPFQLEPALAVVGGLASRFLLADDVGLGKTVQAGLIVAEVLARRPDAHALVLCPAGLRQQWHDELAQRFRVAPATLDSFSLPRSASAMTGANPWAAHSLVLASIDFVKRPEALRALEPLVWDLLVIDEAHGTAGRSDRHVAATLLAQRARVVVMLTATPHSGDEAAFSRLTDTGNLDSAFPLLVFRRSRADVSLPAERRTRWLAVRPTRVEAVMHRALMKYVRRVWSRPASPHARLAMIVLTRRACSSAFSLTRSLERRLALLVDGAGDGAAQLALPLSGSLSEDDEPGAEIGTPGLEDIDDERRSLEGILTLARRVAGDESKLRALARFLRRVHEPVIIFTEYRDTLAVLERTLFRFGTCQLHGGLTGGERADVLARFTAGERRVLLATDAASEGLNLQHRCRMVVHLEVPWTPTRTEQRVGRVDRIGQTRTVHQLHLVAADTVEQSRVEAVVRRQSRVAFVLDALSTRAAHEHAIAAYAIAGDTLPTDQARGNRPAMPAGLIAASLRIRATDEAERLAMVRRLLHTERDRIAAIPSVRPFTTAARATATTNGSWAFWLDCIDSEEQLLWEALVGVTGVDARLRSRSSKHLRAAADGWWPRLANALADTHQQLVARARAYEERTVATAIARERAIARGAESHHARLAANLVQGALFDRRAERHAALQRDVLEGVLARCHVRILELQRRRLVTAGAIRPAFSLMTW